MTGLSVAQAEAFAQSSQLCDAYAVQGSLERRVLEILSPEREAERAAEFRRDMDELAAARAELRAALGISDEIGASDV